MTFETSEQREKRNADNLSDLVWCLRGIKDNLGAIGSIMFISFMIWSARNIIEIYQLIK